MVEIPMRTKGAVDRDTLLSLGAVRVRPPYTAQSILALNEGRTEQPQTMASAAPLRPCRRSVPRLMNPMQKGQKISLAAFGTLPGIEVRLGWNTRQENCEVDVSAFLLGEDGKVIGDDWFVFYGQPKSPDQSTSFMVDGGEDREVISVDFRRLHPSVKKMVFVLTIHEAFEKKLHFGMVEDAYIRILDTGSKKELVSFQMTDYYSNVISMMIGEIYLYKETWKFHGIGSGVAKDLAGLCALYGVEVSG